MNFIVNSSNIQVTQDQGGVIVKIGNIQDSCCNTNIVIKGVKQPIIFDNERGKGGFLNTGQYYLQFIEAFKLAFKNEKLRSELDKFPVTIKKSELLDGSYLNKLR